MKEFLEYQSNGDIEQGLVFLWDSVGSIGGLKSYNSKVGNNMFDAGTISAAFQDIMESIIPSSRKISSKYTNTFIMVNKVWLDSTSNPVAPPSMEAKGGKSITYRSRLVTKIKVLKNQLPSPFNVTYEGEFICTDIGIIGMDKDSQEEYKKTRIPTILKKLQEMATKNGKEISIEDSDVDFVENEEQLG